MILENLWLTPRVSSSYLFIDALFSSHITRIFMKVAAIRCSMMLRRYWANRISMVVSMDMRPLLYMKDLFLQSKRQERCFKIVHRVGSHHKEIKKANFYHQATWWAMRETAQGDHRSKTKVLAMEALEETLGMASNLKLRRSSLKIHLNLRLLSSSMGSARSLILKINI